MTKRERIQVWDGEGVKVALIFDPGRKRFVVEHYRNGRPRRRIFTVTAHGGRGPAKKAAQAYAGELFRARQSLASDERLTIAALFERYVLAMEGGWRPATRVTNLARWRQWEAFIKPESDPDRVTADDLDRFHKSLRMRERPISPNQVRQVFGLIRTVYRLGNQRRWVRNPDPVGYSPRISKDEKVRLEQDPEEYHPDEWRQLLAVVDARQPQWWRLGVAMILQGVQGQRIHAVRHLTLDDVDFEAGVILWPAIWQKQGRDLQQPLLSATRTALDLALSWRAADGYQGRYFLYAGGRGGAVDPVAGPVPYSTINSALNKAEKLAGVEHRPYRSTHGQRRMSAENVYSATGDMLEAAEWIGDRDLKQLKSYLKRREGRMERAANATEAATSTASIVPSIVPSESDDE